MSERFKTVIGLEIHVQLNTQSKMFCGCDNNAEGKTPNSVVCPICLGMPGTLPTPNREAIASTLKLGLALGSNIPKISKFDRKHYFYPDLPKGYQISQYDAPFCIGGELEVNGTKVRLTRIHLEEDAGKLVHPKGSGHSYVDLNRAGTPLLEIVSEPDISSAAMAKEYMKELHSIIKALGISDADMEKGHLRCDANISVVKSEKLKVKSSEIVEMKNLNSFRFVERALTFEEKRLKEAYKDWPSKPTKVTRRFDAERGITCAMREKEEAKDYRYFPEPDIPPFDLTDEGDFPLEQWKSEIQQLLPSRKKGEMSSWKVEEKYLQEIAKNPHKYNLLEKIAKRDTEVAPLAAKILVHEKSAADLGEDSVIDLVEMIRKSNPPSNIVRKIIAEAVASGERPSLIFTREYSQAEDNLGTVVDEVISENQDAAEKVRSGKNEVMGFLVGQVMRKTQGKANPRQVKDKIEKKLIHGGKNG